MNLFFHFVTPEYYPDRGGLQQSLRRIASSILNAYPGAGHAIYVLETKAEDYGSVHFVKAFMKKLTRPLAASSSADTVKQYKQLRYLALENLVKEQLERFPNNRHLMISFYASHTGFYSQMVASRFHLPHITSIRGSDFFVNFLNHTSFGSLEFVLQHADMIVCTNNGQRDLLQSLYRDSLAGKITTIHNALEGIIPPFVNRYTSRQDRSLHLFTDSGFSYKKGTDQIIEAFLRLIKEGDAVELTIAGDIREEEHDYWVERIQLLKEACGYCFRPVGYQDSVIPFLEQADIFISASLSEGCSNSRIQALCMGIPFISTDNGAVQDYPFPKTNLVLVPVGNPSIIASRIRSISCRLAEGMGQIPDVEREERLRYFSTDREQSEWTAIIDKVLEI